MDPIDDVRELRQPLEGTSPEFQQRLADAAERAEESMEGSERTHQAEVENALAEESGDWPPNSINYEDPELG